MAHAEDDDADAAPPSIWDGAEARAGAGRRAPDPLPPGEAALRRQLAGASVVAAADAALARLDERLAASGIGAALAARLAATEAEALARLMGWRGADGDSALRFRYAARLDDEADGWARWAARTLAAPAADVAGAADAAALAARLAPSGWRRLHAADALGDGEGGPVPRDGEALALLDGWLAAARAADGLGPAARGAMGWRVWAAGGGRGTTAALTGAVLAMRFAAGADLAALRFAPMAAAARRLRPFDRGLDPADALARWCRCVAEACRAHAREVERLLAWRAAARDAERTAVGRAVIDLLVARREIMSEDVAHALGVTQQGANQRLRALRDAGVIRQASEGTRFRRWAAAG